jgi:methylated-DNA-protein-cysteine methyltransferase-like protein
MVNLPDPLPFFRTVWLIVQQVPPGQVTTFSQIARMIPPPPGVEADDYARLGARWVGDAMNAVSIPDDARVPWHRVINSRGTISLPERSRGAALQRERLLAEGIVFDAADRVDFERFGWDGGDPAWAQARGLLPARSLRSGHGGQMTLF